MKPYKRKYKMANEMIRKMREIGEFPINEEYCSKIIILSVKESRFGFYGYSVEVQCERTGKSILLAFPWIL